MPERKRPLDDVLVFDDRDDRRSRVLCYTSPNSGRHALCWVERATWVTVCGIQLGPPRSGSQFRVDLWDLRMDVPTCMLCIDVEEGRPMGASR